jgi:hypothetical protein
MALLAVRGRGRGGRGRSGASVCCAPPTRALLAAPPPLSIPAHHAPLPLLPPGTRSSLATSARQVTSKSRGVPCCRATWCELGRAGVGLGAAAFFGGRGGSLPCDAACLEVTSVRGRTSFILPGPDLARPWLANTPSLPSAAHSLRPAPVPSHSMRAAACSSPLCATASSWAPPSWWPSPVRGGVAGRGKFHWVARACLPPPRLPASLPTLPPSPPTRRPRRLRVCHQERVGAGVDPHGRRPHRNLQLLGVSGLRKMPKGAASAAGDPRCSFRYPLRRPCSTLASRPPTHPPAAPRTSTSPASRRCRCWWRRWRRARGCRRRCTCRRRCSTTGSCGTRST